MAVVMKEDRAEFRSLCLWFKSGDHTRVDEWSGRLVCGGAVQEAVPWLAAVWGKLSNKKLHRDELWMPRFVTHAAIGT